MSDIIEEKSFTALVYEEDCMVIADSSSGYDTLDEAIEFVKRHNWDEVVDDTTGKVVYRNGRQFEI